MAILAAWTEVTDWFADATLADVKTAAKTDILAFVNTVLNVEGFQGGEAGPMLRMARLHLAAHFGSLSLKDDSAPAGPVSMEKAGDLSRSYASASFDMDPTMLATTSYGRTYLGLVRMSLNRLPIGI